MARWPGSSNARMATLLWFVPTVMGITGLALAVARPDGDVPFAIAAAVIFGIPFCAAGTLILWRLPRHLVGWTIWTSGFLQVFNVFGEGYGLYNGGSLPAAPTVLACALVAWMPSLALLVAFIPLLFPTGYPLTPRWRWTGWLTLAGLCLVVLPLTINNLAQRDELVRNAPDGETLWSITVVLAVVGAPFIVLGTLASIASLIVRFWRARGVERQQLKWFSLAILLNVVNVSYMFTDYNETVSTALNMSFIAVPITIVIAILRYRLYDIDLIINRTLVYGTLTASLLAVYLALVFGAEGLVRSTIGEDSSLVVAGSTLAVAALFQPLRSRIQRTVDRRFYRRKYDATKTIEMFNARLRDEIDLATLSLELQAAIHETMQPAHMAIWLRTPEPAGRSERP